MASALAAEGHETRSVDAQAGAIYTVWQDTGFLYGQLDGRKATLLRRYAVIVSPQNDVTVRADLKRCAVGGFAIGDLEVRGRCEAVEGLTEGEQAKLDALGQRLEEAVAASSGSGAKGGVTRGGSSL